jgi:uncharacterized protein (TIRG00374 family)
MQPEDQSPPTDQNKSGHQTHTSKYLNNPRFKFRKELIWGDAMDVTAQPTVRLAKTQIQEVREEQEARFYKQIDDELEANLDTGRMNSVKLMQLSSILQAARKSQEQQSAQGDDDPTTPRKIEDRQFIDPRFVLEKTLPIVAVPKKEAVEAGPIAQPAWKTLLGNPIVKVILGAAVGIGMLYLLSRFVNVPVTVAVLRKNLTTPQGIMYAVFAALSFIAAFSIRGTRWRMFLRPIGKVQTIKAIQIYWVGVFINVLLPVQGGEVAKSLMLKRVTNIPVSKSLPTVAMDKALDLMPALFIMAIVPFLPGIHMSITLWLILALVGGILIGLITVVGLTAWNREFATRLIKNLLGILPGGIGGKIEGFAMGFVDSLLGAASRPKVFIPAVLLTCLAISCDGLFAMFAFWTVGLHMNFGAAIFGYTVFNMFTILPTPPGQVGSNEIIGTLVFGGLLGFNKANVLAMFVFSHPLTALIMATLGLISLSSLGLKISSVWKAPASEQKDKSAQEVQEAVEKRVATV